MTEKRETIADIWYRVGKLKNPYPNWLPADSDDTQRKKGFSKAKRLVRQMLWEMLVEQDNELTKESK